MAERVVVDRGSVRRVVQLPTGQIIMLTNDQVGAIEGAASPDANNVFATMADLLSSGGAQYVANAAALPVTGSASQLYITEDMGEFYRFDGDLTAYVKLPTARVVHYVYNNTGSEIAAGTLVKATTSDDAQVPLMVAPGYNTVNGLDVVGVTMAAIADQAYGYAMERGLLTGVTIQRDDVVSAYPEGIIADTAGNGKCQSLNTALDPDGVVVRVGIALDATTTLVSVGLGVSSLNTLYGVNTNLSKTTPVDADAVLLQDSEDSSVWKKVTWANIKATLKSYFDGIYAAASALTNHLDDTTDAHDASAISVVTTNLGRNLPATTACDQVQEFVELVDELPIKFGVQNTLLAAPTLDDTYSGGNYEYLGGATSFNLPTGAQTLAGWWAEFVQRNGQITFVAQGSDLLLHKDGHSKTSAAGAVARVSRPFVGVVKIVLTASDNFAVGGYISGQASGVGVILYKVAATHTIYVAVSSGTFSNGQNVDNTQVYSAAETTINGVPVTGVNIYEIVGQTST